MKYQPVTCVWEVTMGCNMNCGHCGSSCEKPQDDQLNTDDAVDLCNQIAELGLKWVTLSGGEPLTRGDIDILVKTLSEKGVAVNMITNGWLLDRDMAKKLKENGISTVAISIDGTPDVHDYIRKKGAFSNAKKAFQVMKEYGIDTGAVTTITKQNIDILDGIKDELVSMGVHTWQVQLGLPMGNLKKRPEWVLEPEQVKYIIDFCYDTAMEGKIGIYPADCIGYYTWKELEVKRLSYRTDMVSAWNGCNAGVRGFGILQDGSIVGCTSIRSSEFIEGNIKERPLREIWEDEESFKWRRQLTKDMLSGSCKNCIYGSRCLGGCPNTRLTMNGSIYSENQYCAYNLSLKKMEKKYKNCNDAHALLNMADSLVYQGDYQEAAYALEQAGALEPGNIDILKSRGYCEFMCGNYDLCLEVNKKVLEQNGTDTYAMGGYALALFKLGHRDEGIKQMRRAVELTGGMDQNLLQDLNYMLSQKKPAAC